MSSTVQETPTKEEEVKKSDGQQDQSEQLKQQTEDHGEEPDILHYLTFEYYCTLCIIRRASVVCDSLLSFFLMCFISGSQEMVKEEAEKKPDVC